MVPYCVESQRRAKREIGAFSGPIQNRCKIEWSDDYETVMDYPHPDRGSVESDS